MQLPVVRGTIDRRILVNFRVDPTVLERLVPAPFRPKLVGGLGMAGVCLIRLKHIRPRWLPPALGLTSENAAHRIAVEWERNGEHRQGVFIPRRDTSSRLNSLVGGHLFPGEHRHARFQVAEAQDRYHVRLDSDDGHTHLVVEGHASADLPGTSVFRSLREASEFFEAGSLGYSVTSKLGTFDGLELRSFAWRAQPLAVDRIESSFFEDRAIFPAGSVEFDCALLMKGVEHEWHGREPICAWSMN
ncbi:MAG TPA: DUF2071 domain-containing protein [Pirellulales bacterium]|nr:DUF2071 domain-containing protein [Pirellulales bacterium]